ncbi:hypothetical protein [Tissierella praeacuta]|nr:hypothetical protein [Tissierella praeacuta]
MGFRENYAVKPNSYKFDGFLEGFAIKLRTKPLQKKVNKKKEEIQHE